MADSRTFVLINGITIEAVGEHLVQWFRQTKNMIAEGGPAQGGGYFVQAKDQEDGWKKISGMTKAIQIQILRADQNIIVNCDFGNWSDKVGAGVVGAFVFAPLAVTAAYGAVKQKNLPNEIFAEIERFIMMGGQSIIASVGPQIQNNQIECSSCHKLIEKGQKFCPYCGNKAQNECPNCGAPLDPGVRFCPNCGANVVFERKCPTCGNDYAPGTKFCSTCGTKLDG